MKKIRINAVAMVRDIKGRLNLKNIMENHGLSHPTMLKVRNLLIERGFLAPEDFDYLNLSEGPSVNSVSARAFLASFRGKPDDLHLMEKYKLTAKELQVIYDTLILAGLVSEYEYHSRDRKAPELDDAVGAGREDSTEVTLLRNELDMKCVIPQRAGDIAPRKSFPNDSIACRAVSARPQKIRRQPSSDEERRAEEKAVPDRCPKCGLPSHPSAPDACLYYGVVFSKAKPDLKYAGVAIWDLNSGGRYN